jgi:hypothetical protein
VPRTFACALAAAGLLVAIAALAPAAPVPQHLMRPAVYYFPIKVGTKLEYEDAGVARTLVVTGVSDRGGAKVVTVGRVASDDSVSHAMTMAVTGTGLFRVERAGRTFDVPEAWLILPAERDRVWEYPTGDPTVAPRQMSFQRVIGTQDITVPAGTFRCVGVNSFHNGRSVTCWYAPDVGLVKTEAATWTEVLKSYTPGKD